MLDRRRLLKGIGAASLVLGGSRRVGAQFSANPFSLGVASGDPAPDGFVIWTRLAPDPLNGGGMPAQAVEVAYEVAEDEGFAKIVQKGQAQAVPDFAHSVHVEVGGLSSAREYFYRFTVGKERSGIGRAKTLPPAGGDVQELRFGVAGCQRWEHGYYTAFRHLADERFDFVFHYGDYIYALGPIKEVKPNLTLVRRMPEGFAPARTLADYRNRYGLYKSDADLQAAHASTPFIPSFDDHEITESWNGQFSEGSIQPQPSEAFVKRRAAAFQAWYEHMPVRKAQQPRGSSVAAYRRIALGNLATLNVLDTRQYRTAQPCGKGFMRCPDALDAARGLLGDDQERWLYDGLKQSQTRWNVLAQQVFMMRWNRSEQPGVLETHTDRWDGAVAGRDRLFTAIADSKVSGVVTLTGDVHDNWAGDLKRRFDDEKSATLGVEFIATSISSDGDGTDSRRDIGKVRSLNPHIKFFNGQRGYVRHIVKRDRWQADFRVVDKVSEQRRPIATRKSLTTELKKPGVQDA
jgi:alkaline phosphatase D